MKTKSILFIVLFTLIAIALTECKKKDDGAQINNVDFKGKLNGTVVNENDQPIQGVLVKVGSQSATTDNNGKFTINQPETNNGKALIKATKSGYFPGYLTVTKIDESGMFTVVKLLQSTDIGTVNSSTGGNLSSGSNLAVLIGNTGFITESGSDYTGQVTVRARYVAADDTTIDQVMPGGFSAVDTGGQNGVMITQGVAVLEFVDPSGNIIKPKPGNVKLSFQVPSAVVSALSSSQAWTLNTQTGQWNTSGGVTIVGNKVTVDFLSTAVNCDFFSRVCTVNGKVIDCNGNPKVGARVTFVSNLVRYSTYTNGAGLYRVELASDPGSYIISSSGKSVSVSVQQGATITAPDIIPNNSQFSNTYSQFGAGTSDNSSCRINYQNATITASLGCSGNSSSLNISGAFTTVQLKTSACYPSQGSYDVDVPLNKSGSNYSGSTDYQGFTFALSNGVLSSDGKTFTGKITVSGSYLDAPVNVSISLQ